MWAPRYCNRLPHSLLSQCSCPTTPEIPLGAVVRITNGAKVRMFGFTVTGPVPCAVDVQGIAVVEGARLTLAESHITPMRPEPEPSTCNPGIEGIRIGFPASFRIGSQLGSTGHGKITDVSIDQYLGNGIGVGGPPGGAASTATISHTVILEGTALVSTLVKVSRFERMQSLG